MGSFSSYPGTHPFGWIFLRGGFGAYNHRQSPPCLDLNNVLSTKFTGTVDVIRTRKFHHPKWWALPNLATTVYCGTHVVPTSEPSSPPISLVACYEMASSQAVNNCNPTLQYGSGGNNRNFIFRVKAEHNNLYTTPLYLRWQSVMGYMARPDKLPYPRLIPPIFWVSIANLP